MSLLSFVLLLSCLPSALIDFALPKWEADPDARIEEAYKWLYQATRGGEHMAPSRTAAAEWLEKEWAAVGPAKVNEPIWEPLCPDGRIGRINIRPFKDRGGTTSDLVDAFLSSSQAFRSEPESFLAVWKRLGLRLKARRTGNFRHSEWLRLDAEMAAKDYPAVRHSKNYTTSRQPAYRVITAAEAQRLVTSTGRFDFADAKP
jgi:hypothetical protein